MSENKKEKVIHVDKLIIHAKDVEIINEQKENVFPKRDPWGFFWGRSRDEVMDQAGSQEEQEVNEDQ
ncbi:hypothetical protein [Bacillus sp. FJAT-47783]|uniref:hypothetical protein n=1 Tax=Bacillus sp. FJAT-47783 TaxID=2922712 RepID=UPI001FAC7210|nr:hypothetical protein [Bacillus sp. FJAT-47783]